MSETPILRTPEPSSLPDSDPETGSTIGSSSESGTGSTRKAHTIRWFLGGLGALMVLLSAGWATLPLWIGGLPAQVRGVLSSLVVSSPEGPAMKALVADVDALRVGMDVLRLDNEVLRQEVGELHLRGKDREQGAGAEEKALDERTVTILQSQIDSLWTAFQDAGGQAMSQESLEVLRNRIDDLATKQSLFADSYASVSSVLPLIRRVTELETAVHGLSQRQDQPIAFLLAVVQLRLALESGRPFSAMLETARALAPAPLMSEAFFETAGDWAGRGIPTKAALWQRLHALGPDIIRSDLQPDQSVSWVRYMVSRLSGLVTVSRVDGQALGYSPAVLVSRAEASVRDGDLKSAVIDLERLSGSPAGVVFEWLEAARARLWFEQSLEDMTAQALRSLSAVTPASGD